MRLIDADALMKEFRDFVRDSNNSDFAPVPTWNDAVSLVGSAPTADAQEGKHGEWKMQMLPRGVALFYCSECGYGKHIEDNRAYGFCPNCGADMRGGDTDA